NRRPESGRRLCHRQVCDNQLGVVRRPGARLHQSHVAAWSRPNAPDPSLRTAGTQRDTAPFFFFRRRNTASNGIIRSWRRLAMTPRSYKSSRSSSYSLIGRMTAFRLPFLTTYSAADSRALIPTRRYHCRHLTPSAQRYRRLKFQVSLVPYALRYFIPVSHITVTTVASGPSCSANRKAAMTLPPVEVPAKSPSSQASRSAIAVASSVEACSI